jgi:hypothetical protein
MGLRALLQEQLYFLLLFNLHKLHKREHTELHYVIYTLLVNYFNLHYYMLKGGKVITSSKCQQKKTPWSESASELYRPSYRRLSAK